MDSLVAQTHTAWTLHYRDDGSADGTTDILREFCAGAGCGRCTDVSDGQRLGAAKSFLHLLATARTSVAAFFAFADQDDVWLPEKLARGVDSVDPVSGGRASAVLRASVVGRRGPLPAAASGAGASATRLPYLP